MYLRCEQDPNQESNQPMVELPTLVRMRWGQGEHEFAVWCEIITVFKYAVGRLWTRCCALL